VANLLMDIPGPGDTEGQIRQPGQYQHIVPPPCNSSNCPCEVTN